MKTSEFCGEMYLNSELFFRCMNKKWVVFLVIVFFILVVAAFFFVPIIYSGSQDTSDIPEVRITYENFEDQLMRQSLVQDIPDAGVMALRFYTFDSGERTWENSYILRKANVQKGVLEDVDITLAMHSKYLEVLTNKNLCAVIITAKEQGDVAIETSLSSTALAWKYRSMLRYKGCLGLG